MKVLVAATDSRTRATLGRFVTSLGHEVVEAADEGAAAEALATAGGPGVVLVSGDIPPRGEAAAFDRLRQGVTRPVHFILVTSDGKQRVAGLAAGTDLLADPVDLSELQARLVTGRRLVELQTSLDKGQEALRFEASHDALTGIWNRAAILALLGRELDRSGRERLPVGIVLVDLDSFQAVNERHGAEAGDEVLRETVRRIRVSIRPYDTIGRYGAEEFLVVLPGCNAGGALSMAERIREDVAASAITTPAGPVAVTVSLGVTAGGEGSRIGPADLVAVAATTTRRAKQAGGGRAELAGISDLEGLTAP